MQINKAIITAAGKSQSHLPLQTVVDRSGEVRTALGLLLDEVTGAGIDEVAIIIRPGDEDRYRQSLNGASPKLTFFEQHEPRVAVHLLPHRVDVDPNTAHVLSSRRQDGLGGAGEGRGHLVLGEPHGTSMADRARALRRPPRPSVLRGRLGLRTGVRACR